MAVDTRMAPNRSGSAPPTVEGSIAALRTFMDRKNPKLINSRNEFSDYDSEERMRADPAYIAYYHANVNLNPRLPPPIISQHNCHLMRLTKGSVGSKKISAAEGLLATHREEPEEDVSSQQSFVAVTEMASTSAHDRSSPQASPSVSIKAVEGENHHVVNTVSTADQIPKSREQSSGSINVPGDVHHNVNTYSEDNVSTQCNIRSDISVTESRMKSSDISTGLLAEENQRRLENLHFHDQNTRFQRMIQPFVHNAGLIPPVYATTATYMNSVNLVHPGLLPGGYPSPQFSPGVFRTSSGHHPPPLGGYVQNTTYPLHINFFKTPVESLTGEIDPYRGQMIYQTRPYVQNAFFIRPFTGPIQGRYFHPRIQEAQAAVQYKDGYPPSLGVPQFPAQFPAVHGIPISGSSHPGLGNDLTTSQHPPTIPAALSGWKEQRGSDNSDDCKKNSFLELLKSSSSKKLELSDISGQIVEFSTDQHGSRFIQQKLEHCCTDEKDSVFKEVLPYALKLMTDVFGNYVIQKFFEHGTLEQRKLLGEQLTGQVLSLSLQMYGCRVIQKALEVIELDQKVKLVQELDGHVMRCVHDQNGNHVIQKCIEAVPAEKIGFIISSFHGEVSALSSHPYGCRVIQRVLEHCSDEHINRFIVGEILDSACTLAQDPYGNYVTQHILEMGKAQERSQIIQKLTGKFKQMSQLKYASNVVEKCLKYGNAAQRDLIIEEFISGSDDNADLLMLMKDQFANYVVQKIFDIGTEKQKEAFLDCIKSNLLVLTRFTYAKQIVARYEQMTEGSAQDQT